MGLAVAGQWAPRLPGEPQCTAACNEVSSRRGGPLPAKRDPVEFVGLVVPDKVPALIDTATMVVMPSRREGFGLVALEAAMMARPVVATRVGGLPEVVKHNETGMLVPNGDKDALADAMVYLLTHPEYATEMGQGARRRAIKEFSWQRNVDAYDALYRQLITEARKKRSQSVVQSALPFSEKQS